MSKKNKFNTSAAILKYLIKKGKLKEFNTGGDIAEAISGVSPILDSVLPGVGTGISAVSGAVGSILNNMEKEDVTDRFTNENPYGYRGGGEIKIKESKKGTFTKAAKKRGMGVQEFASKVTSNPDQYSEAMRKKAQFAKNAAKWDKEQGGEVYKHGGEVTGYKQYNAPQHEQGGQTIGQEGNVTSNNPVAEIEGKENKYTYNNLPGELGRTYIFSDDNGTSEVVRDIISKYKGGNYNPDKDAPSRNAMEMEIKNTENTNEFISAVKDVVQTTLQKRYGGTTEYQTGGPILGQIGQAMKPAFQKYIANQYYNDDSLESQVRTGIIDRIVDANTPTAGPSTDPYLPNADNEVTLNQSQPNPITGESPISNQALDPLPARNITAQQGVTPAYTNPAPQLPNLIQKRGDIVNPDLGDADLDFGTATSEGESTGIKLPSLDKILRAGAYGFNAAQLFQKPLEEDAIIPDYSEADQRFGRMSADLTQARQDAVASSNLARNLSRSSAGSFGQYRARELANIGNLQDSLGRIGASEQQLRNQIAQTQGQYETGKAQDIANRLYQTQQANIQNAAQTRNLRRAVVSDFMAEADRLSTIENNKNFADATIQEGMSILRNKYPDFEINEQVVTELQQLARGEKDLSELSAKSQEIIKFRN